MGDANCGTGAGGTRNTWIGLNDLSVQGTYEWVSGEECDGDCIDLDWWHPNQPSSASQRCISIRYNSESIDELFNDGTCSNELCFVCDLSGAHYVAHGKTSWSGWGDVPDHYCQSDDDNQAAHYSSYHDYDIGVGCCSQDGTSGYRPDCDAHPATYQEAVDLCEENGYRLCTVAESESGITVGTGCMYNRIYQWTSDSCDMTSSSAHAPQHGIIDWVKAANVGGGDWQKTVDTDAVVVLTAKDLVILVLLGTALVLATALIVICIRRSGRRTKYAPVGVVSDSEAEKFRN